MTVTAGVTYVVSYYAPNGHYAADPLAFIYRGVTAGPLTAFRSISTAGNGVYKTSAGFPTSTYNAPNYYVDVVFISAADGVPMVVANTPAADATDVAIDVKPTATFSRAMNASSVQFTLSAGPNSPVAGSASYNASTKVVTFTPSANLPHATTFTAVVQGTDTQGNPMGAPFTFNFTTSLDSSVTALFAMNATPATEADLDPAAIELGVRFSPSVSGTITGIRYYRGAGSPGAQTGSLWTTSGSRLAQVTFPAGSGSGWQVATFSTPVEVAAGSSYVASYYSPNGRYAPSSTFSTAWVNGPLTAPGGNNGFYRYGSGGGFPTNSYQSTNYWVDVLFVPGSGVARRRPRRAVSSARPRYRRTRVGPRHRRWSWGWPSPRTPRVRSPRSASTRVT